MAEKAEPGGRHWCSMMDAGHYHDAREVDGSDTIEDEEEGGIGEWAEAGSQARRNQQDEDVNVREVGGPGWRLVLAHTGNDGDVL